MAVLSPTVVGQIYKAEGDFSGTNAWLNHLPIIDGTASTVDFNDNFKTNAILCNFEYTLASQTVCEVRHTFMSFDTSAISGQESATLSIYGNTNSGVSDSGFGSHSTDGVVIVGLSSALNATDSLSTSDWADLGNGASQPPLLSDVLTSWNVGTSTANVFTFNATGLNLINTTDTFQISICHKFWYDFSVTTHPFAHGNNSPGGDNEFSTQAGAYYGMGDDATYKPFITTSGPAGLSFKINTGAKIQVSSGKFLID